MKNSRLHSYIILIISFSVISPVFSQTANQDRIQLQMAQRYESIGDFQNALTIYLALHKKSSKNYTYFEATTRAYINLRKFDELIKFVENRLKVEPNNLQYQVKLGDAYLRKGDQPRAEQIWSSLLKKKEKDASVYRLVANAWMLNRQFDEAIEVYESGRKITGNEVLFALELAQLYTYRLNYDLASEEYLRFLRKDPGQLNYVQARFAGFKGDFETYQQVTSVLKRWINREPNIGSYRKLFISFLISFENYEDAFDQVKKLEKFMIHDPPRTIPGNELFHFGRTVITEKQYKLAEKVFQHILNNFPQYPNLGQVEYELARTFFLQNKLDDALVRFDRITQKYPKSNWSLQACMTRGEIFLNQLFLPDSAAKVFNHILELFPKHDNRALAFIALGNVELSKNQLEKAEDSYNKGIKILIRNARLRQEVQISGKLKLAEIAFFKKDYESAKKNLQSILKTQSRNMSNVFINDALELLLLIEENAPGNTNALGEYAEALLLNIQNKVRESAERFESIPTTFSEAPLNPQALFQSAQLKEKLGDFLSAVFNYQSIVQKYSTSTLCDLSLWQIGRIQEGELKNISKAIESYESILLNYPESMLAEKARKKIRDLEGKS